MTRFIARLCRCRTESLNIQARFNQHDYNTQYPYDFGRGYLEIRQRKYGMVIIHEHSDNEHDPKQPSASFGGFIAAVKNDKPQT